MIKKNIYIVFSALFLLVFSALMISGSGIEAQNYRDQRIPPDMVMDFIGLESGMKVGEAGAGSGYFTFKLAVRVGETGTVYANDILESELQKIRERCQKEGISNIHTVLGEIDDPLFPEKDLDLIFMIYAFHDFESPVEWLVNLKKYIKSNAVVAIVDGDPAKTGGDHTLPREKVISYAEQAGYKLDKIKDLNDAMVLVFYLVNSRVEVAADGRRGG